MLNKFDLFSDFSLWNKIHYYSLIHRKKYPNMFFFYFSHSGKLSEEFSNKDKSSIITLINEYKHKINGCWGYLSLFTTHKNGFETYKFFNNSDFFSQNISHLIFQDAIPFNQEVKVSIKIIKDKIEITFRNNDELYHQFLHKFEQYLSEKKEKLDEFIEFSKIERIFACHSKVSVLKQINGTYYSFYIKKEILKQNNRKKNKIINDEYIENRKIEFKPFPLDIDDSFISKTTDNETVEIMPKNIFNETPNFQLYKRKLDGYYSDNKYEFYNDDYQIKYASDKDISSSFKEKFFFSKIVFYKNLRNYSHKYKILDNSEANSLLTTYRKKKYLLNKMKNCKKNRKPKKKHKLREKKFIEDNFSGEKIFDEYSKSIYKSNLLDDQNSITSGQSNNYFKNNKPKIYKRNSLKEEIALDSLLNKKKNLSVSDIKSLYSNDKNCSILNYFPKMTETEINNQLENEVIKTLAKLINNDSFNELFIFIKTPNVSFQVFSIIDNYYSTLIEQGNFIDTETLDKIKHSENCYIIRDKLFDFEEIKLLENFKNLVRFYKDNIKDYFNFYQSSSQDHQITFLSALDNIKQSENLIKFRVKNINELDGDGKNVIKNNIIKVILGDFIEVFIKFSNVILYPSNYFESHYEEIFIRFENFLSILKVLTIKSNEKFIKLVKLFLDICLFQILVKLLDSDLKHLLRNSSSNLKFKYVTFISFFNRLIEIYLYIINDSKVDIYSNQKSNEKSIELVNNIFYEYLYPAVNSSFTNKSSFDDLNNEKKKFESLLRDLFNSNYLDKATFEKSFKSNLYQIFIINIVKCQNLNLVSSDTQKIMFDMPFLQLCHRYLNMLILILVDNKKNLEKFEFLEKFFSYSQNNGKSFYDIENNIFDISNLSTKRIFNTEIKKKLYYRFVNSDITSIMEIQQIWKIDPVIIIKIVLCILKSFYKKKHTEISDCLKKKDLYKLLNSIYTGEEIDDDKVLFFISSCVNTLSFLISSSPDENSRKRILTKFVSALTDSKENFDKKLLTETTPVMGIVPILSVVLSYLKFINYFKSNNSREYCVKNLSEMLNFDNSYPFLKGFTISLFLKLIQNFDQNSKDLAKYITLLNSYVKKVILSIIEMEKSKLKDEDQSILTELYETLHFYIKNLITISEDSSNVLLIKNQSILDELKEVLSIKNVFPFIYKKMVINIINNLCENIYKNSETLIQNIHFNDDDMEIDIKNDLEDFEKSFLEKTVQYSTVLLVNIVNSYITDNRNSQYYKGKVTKDLANYCCEISSKMLGIQIKNSIVKLVSFIEIYGSDKTFFSPKIRNSLMANKNFFILEEITSFSFRTYSIFLKYYSNCFEQFLVNREYKSFHHFLVMFFYGLFHLNCSDKDIYLTMFLDNLTLSKDRIENRAIGFNIMDLNEQTKMEISFYNILFIIIDSKESIELIKSNHSYLQIFFSKLFDSVVIIRKNNALLRKIEAKHLFPLLKNIEEIVLRNIYKNNFNYNYNVGNIFYLIIHQFSDEFLNEKLDSVSCLYYKNLVKFICDNQQLMKHNHFNHIDKYFVYFVEKILINDKIIQFKEIVFMMIERIINCLDYTIKSFSCKNFSISTIPNELNSIFQGDFNRTTEFLLKILKYTTNEYLHYSNHFFPELYFYYIYSLVSFVNHNLEIELRHYYNKLILENIRFKTINTINILIITNCILNIIDLPYDISIESITNLRYLYIYKILYSIELFTLVCYELKIKDNPSKLKKKLNFYLDTESRINVHSFNFENLNEFLKDSYKNKFDEEIECLIRVNKQMKYYCNSDLHEIMKCADLFLYTINNQLGNFDNFSKNTKEYLNSRKEEENINQTINNHLNTLE